PGELKEGKPGEGKPGENKDSKGGDSKGKSEGKGDGKPGEGKSGKPSDGAGKPSEGKPSSGQPNQGQQSQRKSDPNSPPPGQQPPGGQQPNPDAAQVKKQIEDTAKYQKAAEDKIEKKDNPGAADNADKAVDKLKEIEKKLEDLLAQLREEERERLLGKLEGRCRLMLEMQIEVKDGTVELDKTASGKKLDEIQKKALGQGAAVLGDKEDDIVKEADKAIELIRAEGSAIAFAKAFEDVRKDMKIVSANLKRADVGTNTQLVEDDI